MQDCVVLDWGRVGYPEASGRQRTLVEHRKSGAIPDVLVLCEHPHVITLGRNAKQEHLLVSPALLAARGVSVHPTDRGGDITYHGPGQLVGYPILNLKEHRRDVVFYLRQLEETLIRAVGELGVVAGRKPGMTGIWVGEEKLAAIGVHISRWVTSHGFALNVTTDLSYFDSIVPCGISDKKPTSLARLLHRAVAMDEVKRVVVRSFGEVFSRRMKWAETDWEERISSYAQQAAAS